MLIAVGDFMKLKDLILDYRLLTNPEEESILSIAPTDNHKPYTLHGYWINKDSAL